MAVAFDATGREGFRLIVVGVSMNRRVCSALNADDGDRACPRFYQLCWL
jgi:hypothetical protein